MSVRVRFAPSPTGFLHLGGARTALFNWLFARKHKGKFILRVEDTDQTRSTKEAVKAIFHGLEWLGLDWDEGPAVGGDSGPYFQTERLEIYKKFSDQLLKAGKAYFCFCSKDELEQKRKQSALRHEAPRYDGKCRKLPAEEIEKLKKSGKPCAIRFLLPAGEKTIVEDIIRKEIEFENDLLDDFIIVKSDGFPTYNFACVIDDHLMEITHAIRGDDHLSNTPRQVLLYQAFGWQPPKFAHIPMILGSDKTRLSKRHGAMSVVAYRDLGYLPEAIFNYLARLGWGYKDQEIFSRDELIEKFSLNGVTKNPATFDLEKLNWLNGHYIRSSLLERIVDLCLPFIEKAYKFSDLKYITRVVKLFTDRLKLISEIIPLTVYFFKDDFEFDENAVNKHLKKPETPEILKKLKERLEKVDPFVKGNIEKVFKGLASETNVKLGVVIHPCRVSLTGTAQSPPMYDVVEVIGKERVLKRLEDAIKKFA